MISNLRWTRPMDWYKMARAPMPRLTEPSLARFVSFLTRNSGMRAPDPKIKPEKTAQWRAWLLVAGLLLLGLGCYPFHLSAQSQHWSFVEGKIIHSAIPASWMFHNADVEYTYIFNNKTYHNQQIEFGLGDRVFLMKEFAKRVVDRYPTGKQVRILVNPKKPTESVLEATPSMGGGFFLMIGGLLCLFVRSACFSGASPDQ